MALLIVANTKQVAMPHAEVAIRRTFLAAVAITAGQAVYMNSAGKVDLAAGTGTSGSNGPLQFLGIALASVGAGSGVDVLMEGEVSGFGLAGLAYDVRVFVSDTPGSLADAQGTNACVVGRVTTDSSSNLMKSIYIRRKIDTLW